MEDEIDDRVLRLIAGVIGVQKAIAIVLMEQGSLDRDAFEYALETHLGTLPEGALEAAAPHLMLLFLRPDTPPPKNPRPDWLRVVGGMGPARK